MGVPVSWPSNAELAQISATGAHGDAVDHNLPVACPSPGDVRRGPTRTAGDAGQAAPSDAPWRRRDDGNRRAGCAPGWIAGTEMPAAVVGCYGLDRGVGPSCCSRPDPAGDDHAPQPKPGVPAGRRWSLTHNRNRPSMPTASLAAIRQPRSSSCTDQRAWRNPPNRFDRTL